MVALIERNSIPHSAQQRETRVNSLLERVKAAYQGSRTEFFAATHELYKEKFHHPVAGLDTDTFLIQAEKFLNGETFQAHPGSCQRLTAPARAYIAAFRVWENSLSRPDFLSALERLRNAHDNFVQTFIPELENAARYTSPIIALNYPKTLQFFSNILMEEMGREPANWKEKIVHSAPDLFGQLIELAIYKAVQEKPNGLPEIFVPCSSTLQSMRKDFSHLDFDQREALYQKLKGEKVELSPEQQKIYSAIGSLSSSLQYGNEAKTLNAILRTLCEEMRKMIDIFADMRTARLPTSVRESLQWMIGALMERNPLTIEMFPRDFYDLREKIFALKKLYDETGKSEEWNAQCNEICSALTKKMRWINPVLLARSSFFAII